MTLGIDYKAKNYIMHKQMVGKQHWRNEKENKKNSYRQNESTAVQKPMGCNKNSLKFIYLF